MKAEFSKEIAFYYDTVDCTFFLYQSGSLVLELLRNHIDMYYTNNYKGLYES